MAVFEETRYEVKSPVREIDLEDVRTFLEIHPYSVSRLHPSQQINNVYFDTRELDAHWDNKSGVSEREKVRLRWYGDTHKPQKSQLEVKRKLKEFGWKLNQPVAVPLDLTSLTWDEVIAAVYEALDPPMRGWIERYGQPIMINQYQREYYATADRRVRITIDSGLLWFDQRWSWKPNLSTSELRSSFGVVEVKATAADREAGVAFFHDFPYRVTTNSKYVLGVDAGRY